MSSGKKQQSTKENYDEAQPVCNNQNDFNQAILNAIRYSNKESIKKSQPWASVCGVIWVIFFVWALILAMKLPEGTQRVEHVMFAILFSPAYVLANYLSDFNSGNAPVVKSGNIFSTKYT
jgi:hypothetical protein